MPLSEREQQILAELEKNLYEEDRGPARGGVRTRPRTATPSPRNLKLGAFVFLAGVAALIAFFVSQLVILGVAAFAAMVAGIVLLGSALRAALTAGGRSSNDDGASALRDLEERLRQRYRRR